MSDTIELYFVSCCYKQRAVPLITLVSDVIICWVAVLAILGIKEVNNYTGKRDIQDYMSDYIYNFDRSVVNLYYLCTVGTGN